MSADHPGRPAQTRQRKPPRIQDTRASKNIPGDHDPRPEAEVGKSLDRLLTERYFSFRNLAQHSGLNANTLSVIENGKHSPSDRCPVWKQPTARFILLYPPLIGRG
jgi:hypothetical protein